MNTRKALANALREHLRTFPTGDRLAMLRSNPVIANPAIPDDALFKAWEVGLESTSNDELIMSYFTHPESGVKGDRVNHVNNTVASGDPNPVARCS